MRIDMKVSRRATLAIAGASVGIMVAASPAGATTVAGQTLINVRVHTTCIRESQSETETVYFHHSHGLLVRYSPPKVEHTASENYPLTRLTCHTVTTHTYGS